MAGSPQARRGAHHSVNICTSAPLAPAAARPSPRGSGTLAASPNSVFFCPLRLTIQEKYSIMIAFSYQKDSIMSALLVKDPPVGLCDWLKTEARFNRRSVNQQVLICLEWCMKTYGEAQFRNPFGTSDAGNGRREFLHGAELAGKLASLDAVSAKDAAALKRDACRLRKSRDREYSYACFD